MEDRLIKAHQALSVLVNPGCIAELRVLETGRSGTVSGYYSDLNRLARDAIRWNGKAPAVYFTLNPVNESLLARSANRYTERAKHTTKDSDILKRKWLLVDFDAVRASGISSTDEEHQAAIKRAELCQEWLRTQGWPAPVFADSGNGAHLLYRVDLPNTPEVVELLKVVLAMLALQFNDERIIVDPTTFNASRICKLYGTLAAKGDDTPDRPHRYAGLLNVPEPIEIVSRELLEQLAAMLPKQPKVEKSSGNHRSGSFDLEQWVTEHSLDVASRGTWSDGQKWVLRRCPWNSKHSDRAAYIVQFKNGAIAAGCLHQSCRGNDWHTLREMFEPECPKRTHSDRSGEAPDAESDQRGCPYRMTPNGLMWLKRTREGEIETPLTNFTARIVSDIIEDDGAESRRTFEVEVELNGRYSIFTVPAASFAGMNWVIESLGATAMLFPGSTTKDHTRAAIQMLSHSVAERRVYTHTGWRKIDGEWCYMHAGGAIGWAGSLSNIEVRLPASLSRFELPSPIDGDELINAIRASLDVLKLAPLPITVPLYAAVWRAVLGPADFANYLAVRTGEGKSELSAIFQQHFGAGLDSRHLPGSWSSTDNALENLAFAAKDNLLVVDDFAPNGTQTDVARLHNKADRIFRGQGNNSGRQRMRADGTMRPDKPPRGLILSTGEDIPRGHSIRARLFILELSPGVLDWKHLTNCQQDAISGIYATVMSSFLRYLAASYEEVHNGLRKEIELIRAQVLQSSSHKRTPVNVAHLAVGSRYFLRFAIDAGAISQNESGALWKQWWSALMEAAAAQGEHHQAAEPVQRYLDLLHFERQAMPNPKEAFDRPDLFWDFLKSDADSTFEGQYFDRKEAGQPKANGAIDSNEASKIRENIRECISAFANENKEGGLLVVGISSVKVRI
jgi:hypothetical protein